MEESEKPSEEVANEEAEQDPVAGRLTDGLIDFHLMDFTSLFGGYDPAKMARTFAGVMGTSDPTALQRGLEKTLQTQLPKQSYDGSLIARDFATASGAVDFSALRSNIDALLATTRAAAEGYRVVLDQAAEQWRDFSDQLARATAEVGRQLRDAPSLSEAFLAEADEDVKVLGLALAERGWWLYPVVPHLPWAALRPVKRALESGDEEEVDRVLCDLIDQVFAERGRDDVSDEVWAALNVIDEQGARLRFRAYRQAVRAWKLGLDTLIPMPLYAKVEGLIVVASARRLLVPKLVNVYDRKRSKKLTEWMREKADEAELSDASTDILFPIAFRHQPDVAEVLLRNLTATVRTSAYTSEDEIRVLADRPPSRNYLAHGGLGYGRAQAGRALAYFIGMTLLIGDLVKVTHPPPHGIALRIKQTD